MSGTNNATNNLGEATEEVANLKGMRVQRFKYPEAFYSGL
jgi:hypothetical protein